MGSRVRGLKCHKKIFGVLGRRAPKGPDGARVGAPKRGGGGGASPRSSLGWAIWALNLGLRKISAHLMQKISESPGIALTWDTLQTKLGLVWFDWVWFGFT